MFKLSAEFDADSLLCSLSHFKCDGHTVHMLTQQHLPPPLTYSEVVIVRMHSSHSPWLPGDMDITQTVLVMLTMAGLFVDRPCIYILKHEKQRKIIIK